MKLHTDPTAGVVAPPLSSSGADVEVALSNHSGPSPSPSSSCDENCTPPSKNCYRLVVLGSSRVGKTCIVSRKNTHAERIPVGTECPVLWDWNPLKNLGRSPSCSERCRGGSP
ncbi:hypothetical protein RUM43_013562 [Polyplax serrata]|uniref:Uncharacterized protein n=1 Tax=Polyplax serrata TaxID=468196 RepID=A0AAN8S746_POLSC